ncbi:MAG: RluA family pseudouridine synthase [Bacillota bacterium]|nr:RluA family pseudouridine synthase [Bacillota bacterium]
MIERYIVTNEDDGLKLIDILVRCFHLSVRQLRRTKHSRLVRVNGHKISLNAPVRKGDVVELLMEDEENIFAPEPIRFALAYEDEYMIAANKPPFLVVHPTRSHQSNTLGNAVAHHMIATGGNYKIRFVNRLDRDTSGIVLIAKTALVQQRITEQMQKNQVGKRYLAIVEGIVDEAGTIDLPIGREKEDDVVRVVTPRGKRAVTKYERLRIIGKYSLVRIELLTGRTHQIRVHFKAIGHPVLGDSLYGTASPYISRQALHCEEMSLDHPFTGDRLVVRSDMPDDMEAAIRMIESFDI